MLNDPGFNFDDFSLDEIPDLTGELSEIDEDDSPSLDSELNKDVMLENQPDKIADFSEDIGQKGDAARRSLPLIVFVFLSQCFWRR